jgi:hypothetical protein
MKRLIPILLAFLFTTPMAMAQSADVAQVFDLATEAREVLLQLHQKHQMLGDKGQIRVLDKNAAELDKLLYQIQRLAQLRRQTPSGGPISRADISVGWTGIGVTVTVKPTVVVQQAPPPPTIVVQQAPAPQRCEPMGSRRFSALTSAINSESFADGKHRVLNDASHNAAFNTTQVKQVMGLYSFDDDKVQAAARMYPMTCDPGNWFTVYQVLTFDSSRDELRGLVGR